MTLADQYYLKAMDCYPHYLEGAMEAMNYALSYDDEHAAANCLMGRMQMEYLFQYKEAEVYLENALRIDPYFPETYKWLTQLLIKVGKPDKALRLIQFALTIPGIDSGIMYHRKASVRETQGKFKLAIETIEVALAYTYDESYTFILDAELERVKKKLNLKINKKKVIPYLFL